MIIFDFCSDLYDRTTEVFLKTPLRKKQRRSIDSAHHRSSSPDCSKIDEVPSLTLLSVLSAIPFVSGRRGVHVE